MDRPSIITRATGSSIVDVVSTEMTGSGRELMVEAFDHSIELYGVFLENLEESNNPAEAQRSERGQNMMGFPNAGKA